VLVVGHPGLILERFLGAQCQILFCNTMFDWPPSPACWRFEEAVADGASPAYRHLNSGGYIGRTAYIHERLSDIMLAIADRDPLFLAAHGFDDQLAWRQMHRISYPAIKVDTSAGIFARLDSLPGFVKDAI
jgi:hypothetical protein